MAHSSLLYLSTLEILSKSRKMCHTSLSMLSITGVGLLLQDAMQQEQQERMQRTGAGDYKNYSHHNTDAHHITLTNDTHSSTLFEVLTKDNGYQLVTSQTPAELSLDCSSGTNDLNRCCF